jgi:hemin uptake protein HemP
VSKRPEPVFWPLAIRPPHLCIDMIDPSQPPVPDASVRPSLTGVPAGMTGAPAAVAMAAASDGQQSLPTNLPKIIRFDALARCGDEIWIENEGQIYRLRKTRQGKLILTK